MSGIFRKISSKVSVAAGSPGVFVGAFLVVTVWALTGPVFGFTNTWQLVINTFTTICTFLMVFLIQNTQNRDGKAMQLKLDELIRATKARDIYVDLEDLPDDELNIMAEEFHRLHEKEARSEVLRKLHAKVIAEHHRRRKA